LETLLHECAFDRRSCTPQEWDFAKDVAPNEGERGELSGDVGGGK
jgi:hypothetical protein